MKNKILILMLGMFSLQSYGFDLEDYATTYRATRDAYLKAQNELALAKWPFQAAYTFAKKFEAGCYRLEGYNFPNFQGLFDGSCAKDGELPHRSGGPKVAGVDQKIGDKIALLYNLSPLKSVDMPDPSIIEVNYRAYRDAAFNKANQSKSYGLVEIQDCVPTDVQLNRLLKDAVARAIANGDDPKNALGYMRALSKDSKNKLLGAEYDVEDYHTTLRATRDAFLKAANELSLATGPYEAAKEAYQAATAVYVTMSRCENAGYSRRGSQLQDPYEWP